GLVLLDDERVGLDVGILADAGDLPGHLDPGDVAGDGEAPVVDPAGDADQGEAGLVHNGELVAEVPVELLEPRGQLDHGIAGPVQPGDAVVDVLVLVALDGRVDQELVLGIAGVVDGEVLGRGGERPDYLQLVGSRALGSDADVAVVEDSQAGCAVGDEI